MGAQALGEFTNPEVTEARRVCPVLSFRNAIEIAPDCSNQIANVARAAVTSLSVSRGEHVPRTTYGTPLRFLVMEPRPGNDGLPQPHGSDSILIELDGHPLQAVTTC